MTFIANPIDEAQEKAVEAIFKALKVPYKKTKDESSYDPEFVAKIKKGEEDLKAGRGRKITIEELDNLWK
jgi:hypothetical protein